MLQGLLFVFLVTFFFPGSLCSPIEIQDSKELEGLETSNLATRNECVDKDEQFCSSYVDAFGDRFCDEDWFISDSGRYGCKLSCKLCNELEPTEDDKAIETISTTMIPTTTACEDVNAFCPSYKNIYGDRLCNEDEEWNRKIKYECQKTCELC